MKNTTVKNGVTNLMMNLSVANSKGQPVLVPTRISLFSDTREVLDPQGIKNWMQSFEDQAQSDSKTFPIGEFLDAFHKENSKSYSKLTLMFGFFVKDSTYPVTLSYENNEDGTETTFNVAYYNQAAQLAVDASGVYEKLVTIEGIAELLEKSADYIINKDYRTLTDVATNLKDRLNIKYGLKKYNIVIHHILNSCVIEG